MAHGAEAVVTEVGGTPGIGAEADGPAGREPADPGDGTPRGPGGGGGRLSRPLVLGVVLIVAALVATATWALARGSGGSTADEVVTDAFGLPRTPADRVAVTVGLENAIEAGIERCMTARGHDYTAEVRDPAVEIARSGADLSPRRYAEQFGFGNAEGYMRAVGADPTGGAAGGVGGVDAAAASTRPRPRATSRPAGPRPCGLWAPVNGSSTTLCSATNRCGP